MTIYFDNGATSFPKPELVYGEIEKTMRNSSNPGRSGHKMALESSRIIYRTRELLAHLFSINDPLNIVFTQNCTDSLNLGIKGILKKGDHAITTSMEHNSVIRPLKTLEDRGIIELTIVEGNKMGMVSCEDIEEAIRPNTKMIITIHSSNVVGTLLPISKIGDLARKHKIIYMVDAAQSAGIYDINVERTNIDLLAFPGHKGLLGPQGTGGLYIRKGLVLETQREGGTGSQSELLSQPHVMPDRYEGGTLNTMGIAGLGAGVKFILEEGLDNIRKQGENLSQYLIDGLSKIDNVIIYGTKDVNTQVPVVSINIGEADPSEISFILDNTYDIACRSGLHCAPLAHKTIGTFDRGTIRFSMGYFNTMEEADRVIKAVEEISKWVG